MIFFCDLGPTDAFFCFRVPYFGCGITFCADIIFIYTLGWVGWTFNTFVGCCRFVCDIAVVCATWFGTFAIALNVAARTRCWFGAGCVWYHFATGIVFFLICTCVVCQLHSYGFGCGPIFFVLQSAPVELWYPLSTMPLLCHMWKIALRITNGCYGVSSFFVCTFFLGNRRTRRCRCHLFQDSICCLCQIRFLIPQMRCGRIR